MIHNRKETRETINSWKNYLSGKTSHFLNESIDMEDDVPEIHSNRDVKEYFKAIFTNLFDVMSLSEDQSAEILIDISEQYFDKKTITIKDLFRLAYGKQHENLLNAFINTGKVPPQSSNEYLLSRDMDVSDEDLM
tara:strand:+ start:252 stop:656 length:405 start_codon:yes stop_codon:yes gene_type:complete